MFRVLTTVAAVAALAVSAAPASAGTKPPPRGTASFFVDIGTTERLDLDVARPGPPRPGTRSGGEVVSSDAYVKDGLSNTLAISTRRPAPATLDDVEAIDLDALRATGRRRRSHTAPTGSSEP
jgi:hypothetical protein